MPRSVRRFTILLFLPLIVTLLAAGGTPTDAAAADNATQLFSPFTPMEDPNRAVYSLGVLFRANLADLAPGEIVRGMVRYPGALRRLGLRAHSGQEVRILGLDGGLRLELEGGGSVVGRQVEEGYTWSESED